MLHFIDRNMSRTAPVKVNTVQPAEGQRGFKSLLRRVLIVASLAFVFVLSASLSVVFYFRGTTIQVPSVVGKSKAEAEQMLRDKNLKMKVVAEDNNDKVPSGAVFEQDPKPNTDAKEGSAVDVKVNTGKREKS
jgi:beta-lactam-binding protein with PASTA domain